jgi:hypothetical protein
MNFGNKLIKRSNIIKKVHIAYWSAAVLSVSSAAAGSLMASKNPPYKVPYQLWAPFDYETNIFWYLVMLIYQTYFALKASSSTVNMDTLLYFLLSISAGLFDELNERILKIDTELKTNLTKNNQQKFQKIAIEHENKLKDELKRCVDIHRRTFEFMAKVQNIFSPMIFVQAFVSSVILCTTSYTISMVSPFENFEKFGQQMTFMIPMVMQIFLPCYFANEVRLACENLSVSILHSKWYNGNPKFYSCLRIFAINTSRSLTIVAGKIFNVTLENFVTLCQVTYKFYAVLQQLNKN